jgi:RimJ/RimL family protein N-acetyltransferase
MDDPWAWAGEAHERHFGGRILDRYRLEEVDADAYWDIHERQLREHFPPEAYFDLHAIAGEERVARWDRLAESIGCSPLAYHWLIRDPDGALAGEVAVRQRDASTFELYHVNLHPAHRGQGLYADLLRRVLAFAEELGFSTTVSVHGPGNNPVLIAHLRAGFRIVTIEVNAQYGPAVQLTYFHDPDLLRAFEFRCGLATMNDRLHAAGTGHFALLDEQFVAGRRARDEG